MSDWNNENTKTGAREQQRVKSVYKIMKIVKAELILLFILLAILGIQIIGKNINGNNFNSNKLNAAITDDDLAVGENGYISDVVVVEKLTGQGPFDSDDNPGNDSSASNDIVRSYDNIIWTFNITTALNTGAVEQKGGVIQIKAELTEEEAKYVSWNKEKMKHFNEIYVAYDNSEIIAYYRFDSNKISIPGNQELMVILDVCGAPNGLEIKPKFTFNLIGNDENTGADNEKNIIVDSKTTVSATLRLNIQVKRNSSYLDYRGYFDFSTGQEAENEETNENIKFGRMQGYGITLMLYQPGERSSANDTVDKGLKGLEIPNGPITFDIELKEELGTTDVTNRNNFTPLIWAYKENNRINIGRNVETGVQDRNMMWSKNGYDRYATHAAPYNGTDGYPNTVVRCNNGGRWTITKDSTKNSLYHVIVDEYIFKEAIFPILDCEDKASTTAKYGEKLGKGAFSAGYIQVLMQTPTQEDIEYPESVFLTVEVKNLKSKSITNQEYNSEDPNDRSKTDEYIKDNWTRNQIFLTKDGTIQKYQGFIRKTMNGGQMGYTETYKPYLLAKTTGSAGDSTAVKNQEIVIVSSFSNYTYDNDDNIYSANMLQKFDDKAFDVLETEKNILKRRTNHNANLEGRGEFRALYAAKPDKSGWIDDNEMNKALEEDLIYFETIGELKNAGYTCVGVLYEQRNDCIETEDVYYGIRVKIKDTVEIGKVYQITNKLRIWKTEGNSFSWLDQTYTYENGELIYTNIPNGYKAIYGSKYIKTEYDEIGQIKTGTHNNYKNGNSILIVGADLTVDKEITEKLANGAEKTVYNISKNEYDVEFKIKPKLINDETQDNITGVDVKIIEELPVGLKYVPGSSGEEPEIIEQDGKQTLIWYRYNQDVNKEIPDVTYKAHINEKTVNGTEYKTKTTIEEYMLQGEMPKIGNALLSSRQATKTITVIKLGGTGIYKTTEMQIIEVNGEIVYKITVENPSNSNYNEFQLLDILPYNADERGSNYSGEYKVKSVSSTDTNIKLYGTENENIRSKNVKDEDLTNGLEEITSGANINAMFKGIVAKGILRSNSEIEIEVVLQPENNKAFDKYINSASVQISKLTEELKTSNVGVYVIKRCIDGKVWLDNNRDGIIDEGESFLKDVKTTLLNSDGTLAKNIYGNTIESVYTDQDGYYKFEDMAKGKYKVKIEYEDKYVLTEKEVGANIEINSKFNENNETDEITLLNKANNLLTVQEYVNAGLTLRGGKLIVHHYIIKPDGTKTTDKVLLATGEEAEDETKEGNVGDNYETAKVEPIEYYEYAEDTGNTSGVYTLESEMTPIEVIYYYRLKKYPYTVKYYDKETKEEIKIAKEVVDKYYGDEVELAPERTQKIEKYKYDSSDVGKTNKEDKEKLTIGTNVEENVINLYYIKKKGAVITKYIDINTGNEIKERESTTGKIDEGYTTIKKEIAGYTFVQSTDNTEGVYTIESASTPIEVIYFYKKNTKVTVNHIDKDTGKLLDTLTEGRLVGDEYESTSKNFEGYILVEVPEEERVILTEEEIILNYYYSKVPEVIIDKESGGVIEKHIAEDTGKILYNELHKGEIGDKYDIRSREFEGYNLVKEKLPTNSKGEMTKEVQEVIYYYIPKIFNLKVEKWVERASINGTSFRIQQYKSRDRISKLEIKESKITDGEIILTYKIRITNTGEVEGYVEALNELIPEGYEFRQEDNKIKWVRNGDTLITNELKENKIEPGKYKEIEIVLRWKNGETNFGEKTNIITLAKVKNSYNYKEETKEDNQYTSKMVISLTTGLDRSDKIQITKISIYVVSGLMVLALITNRARKRK